MQDESHLYAPILKSLTAPFEAHEIEWRIQSSGEKQNGEIWARAVAYIQARAIQNRLDEAVGPQNWKVHYSFQGEKGVICTLAIKFGHDWIERQDGAEFTDIESFKGGISAAFKRVASVFGIGRYLYDLEIDYAQIVPQGTKDSHYGKSKSGKTFYWLAPKLPIWALPAEKKPFIQQELKPEPSFSDQKDSFLPSKPTSVDLDDPIGEIDLKQFVALYRAKDWPADAVADYLLRAYGAERLGKLSRSQYIAVSEKIRTTPYTKAIQELNTRLSIEVKGFRS